MAVHAQMVRAQGVDRYEEDVATDAGCRLGEWRRRCRNDAKQRVGQRRDRRGDEKRASKHVGLRVEVPARIQPEPRLGSLELDDLAQPAMPLGRPRALEQALLLDHLERE